MGLRSCLCHKSITHPYCNYGPATEMSATVDPDPKKTSQDGAAKTIHYYHPLSTI